jgi:hypothetical protein
MTDIQYLPETARAALAASEISLTELIRVLALDHGGALLMVGSHATGTAFSTSDLDFLILLDGAAEYAGPQIDGSLHMSAGLVERHLAMIGNQEVDIEVLQAERLLPLTATLGRLHLLSSRPAEAFDDFQVLERIELRIIERLRTGIPLFGHEQILRWRTNLHTETLPTYYTLVSYLEAMTWLEDAFSLASADSSALGFAIAVRSAAEELATSALAYHGRVLMDLRFAEKFIDEWNSGGYPLPMILDNLRELLFPESSVPADDYIGRVYRAAADLFEFFQRDGKHPGLAEGIRWFGRDRWQLDVAFLG